MPGGVHDAQNGQQARRGHAVRHHVQHCGGRKEGKQVRQLRVRAAKNAAGRAAGTRPRQSGGWGAVGGRCCQRAAPPGLQRLRLRLGSAVFNLLSVWLRHS